MTAHQYPHGANSRQLRTGRPVERGTHGAVASPHSLATQAGMLVLRDGGHAVDAAIAMGATLSVVCSHLTGVGGDFMCQVWDAHTGAVEGLNGSGCVGQQITRDSYDARKLTAIPRQGVLAANSVPGAVDAWHALHQRYGKLKWETLFEAAITYATDGFPLSPQFHDAIRCHADTLTQSEEAARIYLPDGAIPDAGMVFRQPDLAESLRLIADGAAEVFYRGELGRRLVRGLHHAGGLLTDRDFAEHDSEWVTPEWTHYLGVTVTQLPPNTQGMAALLLFNLMEQFPLAEIGDNTANFFHIMTEIAKLAIAVRNRWITDPTFHAIPIERLVSKAFAKEYSQCLSMEQTLSSSAITRAVEALGDAQDTVYLCAVDGQGNACSVIQSLGTAFGSEVVPAGTGILLHNHGALFMLHPDHPNVLEPRKRTLHAGTPAMALQDDRPLLLFGATGMDAQLQAQAAILTRVIDFGYDIQQAIEAIRWTYGRPHDEQARILMLEGRVSDAVVADLRHRGHQVRLVEDWSLEMGCAQGIAIDHVIGVRTAGADPRGEGIALCW
ncbi:MAG: gamma-glutamyltransferase [Armatimonadota bacterium]